jgi:outer membrane lipoprotein-sorting protein
MNNLLHLNCEYLKGNQERLSSCFFHFKAIQFRYISILIVLSIFSINLFASQQDPEAKKILDPFANKAKSAPTIKINFTFIIENHQNGQTQKSKGELWLKGDKYKIIQDKSIIYYDGKYNYTLLPQSKEVTITNPSNKGEESLLKNPSQIFSIYSKDFKFQYIGETSYNNIKCHEIDLYPFDINKSYSIIKLLINKDDYSLCAARMIMKSGIHYILYVDKIDYKSRIADNEFTFDPKANKDIEVVDLRKQ